MNLMQAIHTIRYLKSSQIAAQVGHRSRRLWEDPAAAMWWEAPAFPEIAWKPLKPFLPPLQKQAADNVRAGKLEFLSQLVEIGFPPAWNRTDLSKLWLYNVQYFEYLWALEYPDARAIVADWIQRHPPARGAIGWDPYPTSLRVMNWCGVFFEKFITQSNADGDWVQNELWPSLYRQMCWLERHIENHLMGNHLFENAVALLMAGACFNGPDAPRWFDRGLAILREQLPEQILSDGGHFERSPMYHCRAVYTLLLLQTLNRPEVNRLIEPYLKTAVGAMRLMTHPDGRIALLNDSALDIYNEPIELAAYAGKEEQNAIGAFSLPKTGYYGSRTRDGSYLICDAGPIGPDHQPGHAHGDMLSFELSLRGSRVIVDSGVYEYPAGQMRAYSRSTRAHNTIEIDSQDQCEFWGSFRVARRGSARALKWSPDEAGFELKAQHDGYARLAGRPVHERLFCWRDAGQLVVKDVVTSSSTHRMVSRLHVNPDCVVKQISACQAGIGHRAGQALVTFTGDGSLSLEESYYCDHFGKRERNVALAFGATAGGRWESGFQIEDSDATG